MHTSYGHTYALINEPAIAPLGEAQAEHRRSSASWRRGWASTSRASPTSDEALARTAFSRRRGWLDFDALRARGWRQAAARRGAVRRRRLPDAERQVPDRRARPRRARLRAELRIGASTPELARALSAGDDLAAGAQLPQLELRQRGQPARHRGRAGARDPSPTTPRRAASSPARARARSSTTAASIDCKAVVGRARAARRRQRPGRLVAQARRATARNVNELTHQRLTDIGRAPSFYDCLVEVEPATARRSR